MGLQLTCGRLGIGVCINSFINQTNLSQAFVVEVLSSCLSAYLRLNLQVQTTPGRYRLVSLKMGREACKDLLKTGDGL